MGSRWYLGGPGLTLQPTAGVLGAATPPAGSPAKVGAVARCGRFSPSACAWTSPSTLWSSARQLTPCSGTIPTTKHSARVFPQTMVRRRWRGPAGAATRRYK